MSIEIVVVLFSREDGCKLESGLSLSEGIILSFLSLTIYSAKN